MKNTQTTKTAGAGQNRAKQPNKRGYESDLIDYNIKQALLKNAQTTKTATACQKTPDFNVDELERWVATTLLNDEASDDAELIEHFMQGDKVPYKQAKFYVDQRNRALREGLTFTLQSYEPQAKTPDMDEYDPLLAAYNGGDGDQRAKPQAAHSPLPWRYVDEVRDWCRISMGDGIVAEIAGGDMETCTANARLIVASVNQAQALAEDAAYWRKRTDEYSLQLAATHNHAEALAEALRDLLSLDIGPCDKAREALANWEAK